MKFPVIFPVSREFQAEQGALQTAHTASESAAFSLSLRHSENSPNIQILWRQLLGVHARWEHE